MKRLLPLLGILLLATPAFAADPPKIVSEDVRIPSDTPGIELFLRNKHLAGHSHFSPARTVLYIHGATQPSETVFDLPIDGTSWADYIAERGFEVWMVDVRGYGRSTRPPSFQQPAADGPPFATTAEAVQDLTSAIAYIRSHRHVEKLDLIGWSWGTVISGAYTAAHPDRVEKLVLLGPPWTTQPKPAATAASAPGSAAATPAPKIGVWQEWTAAEGVRRLQTGVPAGEAERILPAARRAEWEAALLASQPEAGKTNPPRFRSPAGVLADGNTYWRGGRDFYDPARITAPTLILHGEWDEVAPLAQSQALFDRLSNAPSRRLIELPAASHYVIVENGRGALYEEVQHFLEQK